MGWLLSCYLYTEYIIINNNNNNNNNNKSSVNSSQNYLCSSIEAKYWCNQIKVEVWRLLLCTTIEPIERYLHRHPLNNINVWSKYDDYEEKSTKIPKILWKRKSTKRSAAEENLKNIVHITIYQKKKTAKMSLLTRRDVTHRDFSYASLIQVPFCWYVLSKYKIWVLTFWVSITHK